MSDYTDNLKKTQTDVVPEFYVITSGSSIERYTSYSTDLMFLGTLFKAATIKRGRLILDTNFGVVKLALTVPLTDSIKAYIPNQPIEPISVTIYRATLANLNSYIVFFKGKIAMVQMKDNMASAQLESKSKIFLKKIPSIIYQSFCNHDVFDNGCQLDEFMHLRTAIVSSLSTSHAQLELTFIDGKPAPDIGDFMGGRVYVGTDIRLITGHYQINEIDLQIPFDSRLGVGTEIKIYPGCDGSPETCLNRYNNLNHFLGMKYIPSDNPVIWGFR